MSPHEHGQVIDNARWCGYHGRFHGIFFKCRYYTPATLTEIERGESELRKMLDNPDSNIDPMTRSIFKWFQDGQ